MAANTSFEDIDVLEGSFQQLNLETPAAGSSQNNKAGLNVDDIDFWGEDDVSNGNEGDGLSNLSALNREWVLRQEQFHKMGYREGITAGKEASAQEGFNLGFKQSVHNGYNWGLVRGISSAYTSLPDHLKEKLAGTNEKKEKIQNLHQSAQLISTNDALKLFDQSVRHSKARQEQSETSPHSLIIGCEGSNCNHLDGLYSQLISILNDSPEIKVRVEPRQAASQ